MSTNSIISPLASCRPATSLKRVATLVALIAFDLPTLKRPPCPPPICAPTPRESMKKKPMMRRVGTKRPSSAATDGCVTNCTGT